MHQIIAYVLQFRSLNPEFSANAQHNAFKEAVTAVDRDDPTKTYTTYNFTSVGEWLRTHCPHYPDCRHGYEVVLHKITSNLGDIGTEKGVVSDTKVETTRSEDCVIDMLAEGVVVFAEEQVITTYDSTYVAPADPLAPEWPPEGWTACDPFDAHCRNDPLTICENTKPVNPGVPYPRSAGIGNYPVERGCRLPADLVTCADSDIECKMQPATFCDYSSVACLAAADMPVEDVAALEARNETMGADMGLVYGHSSWTSAKNTKKNESYGDSCGGYDFKGSFYDAYGCFTYAPTDVSHKSFGCVHYGLKKNGDELSNYDKVESEALLASCGKHDVAGTCFPGSPAGTMRSRVPGWPRCRHK